MPPGPGHCTWLRGTENMAVRPVATSTETTIIVSVRMPVRSGPASPPSRAMVIRLAPSKGSGSVVVVVAMLVVVVVGAALLEVVPGSVVVVVTTVVVVLVVACPGSAAKSVVKKSWRASACTPAQACGQAAKARISARPSAAPAGPRPGHREGRGGRKASMTGEGRNAREAQSP